jgi:hypothetical protein
MKIFEWLTYTEIWSTIVDWSNYCSIIIPRIQHVEFVVAPGDGSHLVLPWMEIIPRLAYPVFRPSPIFRNLQRSRKWRPKYRIRKERHMTNLTAAPTWSLLLLPAVDNLLDDASLSSLASISGTELVNKTFRPWFAYYSEEQPLLDLFLDRRRRLSLGPSLSSEAL